MRDPNSRDGQEGVGDDEGHRNFHGATSKRKAELPQEQD